jgi:release factor glutamine methyltransferase
MPLWTVRTTLEWTQSHLEAKGAENPRLEAQWLLAAATGLTRLELFTHYDLPLDTVQRATLRDAIKRRTAGEPLQYILGKAPFRHLELKVRPGVLIPRPETEVLVDVVREYLQTGAEGVRVSSDVGGCDAEAVRTAGAGDGSSASRIRVLDLCTGSGCVALALLDECPGVQIVATDIDEAAIELARENAAALPRCPKNLEASEGSENPETPQPPENSESPETTETTACDFLVDDLASSLLIDGANHGSFSVVVSNPPYIPSGELAKLPNEIANYEPHLALDGGADGLDVFRRILAQAKLLLAPGGLFACELHETRLEDAKLLCEQCGLVDAVIHQDLTKRPRIISARQPIL